MSALASLLRYIRPLSPYAQGSSSLKQAIAFAVLAFAAAVVSAQSYPSRLVRMVVAYPAGGSIDVVSRLVNQRLTSALGQ